jgi:hypothetical protein
MKLAPLSRRAHESIEISFGDSAIARPAELHAIHIEHECNQ